MTSTTQQTTVDPQVRALARVYASAGLSSCGDQTEEFVNEAKSFVEDVLKQQPEFANLLTSPMISRDQKLGMIDRVVAPVSTSQFTNLLKVVANHDRLEYIGDILEEVELEVARLQGRQQVNVTVARPMNDDNVNRLADSMRNRLNQEPDLNITVDPNLLGGLIIEVNDEVFDYSLRSRIKQMKDRLHQRCMNEIQSGRNRFSDSTGS